MIEYTRLRRAKTPDELAHIYERFTTFATFISRLSICSFAQAAIQRYEQLKALKLKIGKRDQRIAAIALELGATLVARNRRDFERVPGLRIADWSV